MHFSKKRIQNDKKLLKEMNEVVESLQFEMSRNTSTLDQCKVFGSTKINVCMKCKLLKQIKNGLFKTVVNTLESSVKLVERNHIIRSRISGVGVDALSF